ncbi:MAG: phosphotransferase [Chloroflexota bacterium]
MHRLTPSRQPCDQPGWLGQAAAWIELQLESHGILVNGPIDQFHRRPWSTVLRVPTAEGDVYFKAPASMLAHEAPLTLALSQWRPECVLPLLGIHHDHGWLLMRDGGIRLREILTADRDIEHWTTILPLYANLQMDMVARSDSLLALGTPDRRLARLPALYQDLLMDVELLMIDLPAGLTRSERDRLTALTPHFHVALDELAAAGIPASLDHADLHDGNIYIRGGRYFFFDWSDSSITHPFFSLRTVLASAENTLGRGKDFARLRDAYLEPATCYASRRDVTRGFALAERLWMIPGALVWQRILNQVDGPSRARYAHAVPGLLRDFLAANTDA